MLISPGDSSPMSVLCVEGVRSVVPVLCGVSESEFGKQTACIWANFQSIAIVFIMS